MFKRKSTRLSPQGNYVSLPRGGYVVKSDRVGNIQFGVPPETIKDSMELKIDVPTIYVFPEDLWDRRTGINAAEAEFPAYFNFFILKRKVAFVCTKEQERRIRIVFQETLLGPAEFNQGLTPPTSLDGPTPSTTSTAMSTSSISSLSSSSSSNFSISNSGSSISHGGHGHHRTHSRTGSTSTAASNGGGGGGGSPLRGCTAAHVTYNELVSKNPNDFLQEFAPSYPIDEIPNLELECKYLRTFNSVDELFDFVLFDDNGIAHLPKGVEIHYLEQESAFKVVHRAVTEDDEDHIVSCLPSKIMFPELVNRISTDLFDPPTFGITIIGSSHGFDPKKSTTGFVLWVNKRGIMIDPPLNSSNFLLSQGVPTRRVDHIILTHCHADHDSGTFQKLLEEYQITVVTTPTILNSFLRKYSALSNLSADLLRRLFIFRPVMIGEPMTIAGAEFNFFYTIHTIPTISFEVFYGGKSIYYSGDTCFDPNRIKEMNSKNIMNTARMNFFLKPWNHTVVLHEAGVPPIHTPVNVLSSLSNETKNRLYLVHISEHSLPKDSGLKIAREGVVHTLRLDVAKQSHSEAVDILKLMESVDIFKSIPLSQACEILRTATRKHYSQGTVIIAQDSEPDAFFVVASGVVKVSVGGIEKNLIVGDYFGEMSLIMGTLRSARVTATTDVEVLVFSKEDFLSITRNSSDSINFITKLWEMRNEKSWETINLNSVLMRCTNSQKTFLQSILHREQLEQGQYLWKQGEIATFGCLIAEGALEILDHDSLEPFEKGSFLGDTSAMSTIPPLEHKTTIIAKENSVIYKVLANDLFRFFEHNPGLYLAFLDTMFIDAIRDEQVYESINNFTY